MKKTLALVALAAAFATSSAQAADLGGNCCADLEERIAELEATTARKGNRKVSLQVYGQVNASLLNIDAGDLFDDTRITQGAGDLNSSFVGFQGKAQVTQDVSAGFVLEIDSQQYSILGQQQSNEVSTRQSYLYLKSATLGGISLGKTSNATNGFDALTTANTSIVAQPLSIQPAGNVLIGGLDLPLDGSFRNVVRYDTPVWAGFVASASWGASGLDTSAETGDMWDVALRYADELGGFKVVGGLGYRVEDGQELTVKFAGLDLDIPTGTETKTFLAAGSVMHVASGLFLTGNYADQEWDDNGLLFAGLQLQFWQLQGGIETKLFAVGKSTFYGEFGEIDIDSMDDNADLWGLGFVQAVDAAAMDLYIGYRAYSIGDEDIDTINAGARIKF